MEAMMLIRQGYRFALDPSVEQEALLGSFAGASRFWFNQGLKGSAVKDELAPWRSQVPVGSYQAGLEALGRALQNFSQGRKTGRRVGFPRFRAKGHCRESVIFQRRGSHRRVRSSSTAGSARSAPRSGCRS
jgi:putative transposase